jgi:hypothetical protein
MFQQHLNKEYASLSLYNISELMVSIRIVANKEATERRVPRGLVEVITSKVLQSPS